MNAIRVVLVILTVDIMERVVQLLESVSWKENAHPWNALMTAPVL